MTDTEIKLLLDQKWISLENISSIVGQTEDKVLKTIVQSIEIDMKAEIGSEILLYAKPIDIMSNGIDDLNIRKQVKVLDSSNNTMLIHCNQYYGLSEDIHIDYENKRLIVEGLLNSDTKQFCHLNVFNSKNCEKPQEQAYISFNNIGNKIFMLVEDFKVFFEEILNLDLKTKSKIVEISKIDIDYQYSEVLKPYNDIILAFESGSDDYKKYGNAITKEMIRDSLKYKYKLISSNEKGEFVADLIMEHYKIPKGNKKK